MTNLPERNSPFIGQILLFHYRECLDIKGLTTECTICHVTGRRAKTLHCSLNYIPTLCLCAKFLFLVTYLNLALNHTYIYGSVHMY